MFIRQLIRRILPVAVFSVLVCSAALSAQEPNAGKARALVDAAIKMTNSDEAVKLLWQATEIDPSLTEAYVYLGLYYNSREDFPDMVKVYQKLVKYQPDQVSGYLNVAEAYMQFSPPHIQDAIPYYRKALQLDPNNAFAALRLGQVLAQNGDRDEAVRYLKQAQSGAAKNPSVGSEAEKTLRQMGAL